MPATTKNAEYQRTYRARQGAALAKKRAVDRILSGRIPQRAAMERLGITEAEVNKLRKDAGLEPLDFSLTPIRCRKSDCAQVSTTSIVHNGQSVASDPVETRDAANQTKTSRSIATQTEAVEPVAAEPEPVAETPVTRSSAGSYTLPEVQKSILDLRGKGVVQLSTNGAPVTKKGVVQTLTDRTLKQYSDQMRYIAEATGAGGASNFVESLHRTDFVLQKLRKRYPKVISYKKPLGAIVSVAKYVDRFRDVLGPEPLKVYRDAMISGIKEVEESDVARTESEAVVPMAKIKKGVRDIAKKFGETSLEALAARLQVELVGIRDNLGGVRVVKSARAARSDGVANYYVPRTKKLVITDFKTKAHHPAYNLEVLDSTAKIIQESLKANPRDYLIAASGVGRKVAESFRAVGLEGVGVNTIRHSHITSLLKKNPSEANVKRVAAQFKHSPQMTLRYFRGEEPAEDQ